MKSLLERLMQEEGSASGVVRHLNAQDEQHPLARGKPNHVFIVVNGGLSRETTYTD